MDVCVLELETVIVDGVIETVGPVGAIEVVSDTLPVKPPILVNVIVVVAEEPVGIER